MPHWYRRGVGRCYSTWNSWKASQPAVHPVSTYCTRTASNFCCRRVCCIITLAVTPPSHTYTHPHFLLFVFASSGVDKNRILIKIASTWEGIQACKVLQADGIRCNMTLLFALPQVKCCIFDTDKKIFVQIARTAPPEQKTCRHAHSENHVLRTKYTYGVCV